MPRANPHPTFWRPRDSELCKGADTEFRQRADKLLGAQDTNCPTIPGQQCFGVNPIMLTLKCRAKHRAQRTKP